MTVSVALLRRCFLALAVTGIAGTAAELALSRHWASAVQLIPWYALGVLVVASLLLVTRPRRASILAVRVLAVAVILSAGFGIYEHVLANYHAAPLDFRDTSRWAVVSGSVGPSPTLAPGAMAQAAVCLLFATLGHPALPSGTAASVQRTRSRAKASSSS